MKKALILIFAIILLSSLNCATSDKELQEPKGVLLGRSELEQLFKKECIPEDTDVISSGETLSLGALFAVQ